MTLGPSPYWSMEQSFEGARYWKLWDEPSPSRVLNFVAFNTTVCEEAEGCNLEEDPWRNHRFNDPLHRGSERIKLVEKGIFSWTNVVNDANIAGLYQVCIVYEQIGSFESYQIDLNERTMSLEKNAGWNHQCMNVMLNNTLDVTFTLDQDGTAWINPLGFSGRSSEIFDSTGLRLHHIELKRVNDAKA